MGKRYTKEEIYDFENTVVELACGIETMDEDEYEAKYNSLPKKYRDQVDENEAQFADDAVGDSSWRTGL